MRILLIAYAFPPDPAVGSLRAAKVADALRAAGHEVQVLTAGIGREESTEPPPPWLHIVRPLPGPLQLYRRLKRARWLGRRDRPQPANEGAYATPTHIPWWKRQVLSLVWLPDDLQGFIPPAFLRARQIIRQGVDVLYTTAPPFSALILGWLLRRTTGVRWVAEFRDPWVDSPHKPAILRSRAGDRINRWLERRCLEAATEVIAVAERTREVLQRKRSGPVHLVRNGVDRLEIPPSPTIGDTVRIVYAGSLDDLRDPRPFLHGLARMMSRKPDPNPEVRVEFYGQCQWYAGRPLEEWAQEAGVDGAVAVRGLVPHDRIPQILADAHVLLLLARGQPLQVPNKVYEYLGAGRPILAYSEADGETATLLAAHGGHFLVTSDDVEESARVLGQLLTSLARAPFQPRVQLLSGWSTASQMSRLVAILEG